MVAIGEFAPFFQLEDLESQLVPLVSYRGQVVLLNFWSAECPWAERADQALRDWHKQVPVLSIASNASEPFEVLRRAAVERQVAPVLLDSRHEVADLYGAITTPHCFVIDAEGRLRYQGAFDDTSFRQREPTRFYALEALQAVLTGQPVLLPETPPYGCTIIRHAL